MTTAGAFAVALGIVALALLVLWRRAATQLQRVRAVVERLEQLDPAAAEGDDAPAEALDALERAVERAVAQDAVAQDAESRLERALAAIPQGVVIFDADGELVYRNDPAAGYLAARHGEALVEEAIAQMVAEVTDPVRDADPPSPGAGSSGAGSAGTRPVGTRSVDLFGPPRRTLVLRAIPLTTAGEGGASPGVLVVIDDVSERRRLEAVRRDFVANISHELKTPVGAIALLAETLASEEDPEIAQRLAERVLDEAFRVGRTIDDLLALSRIEAEEAPVREPVPVQLCMAEAVDRIGPGAAARDVTIRSEEPPARLTVLGDRRQLVSALYNLLENAVKYSEVGSTVEVRARTDGRSVDLEVEDHGIGIPRRDLERVFERFYRVDRARSRDTGGTGLGLAIVRHVAANHQGEVRVESQEGEGSTFTLRLPAGPGPVAVTAEAG